MNCHLNSSFTLTLRGGKLFIMLPIADLHCDLLCYLQGDPRRSPFDAAVRCSLPQMIQGGVKLQVLPIFTLTEAGSTVKGAGQAEAFGTLLKEGHFRDKIELHLAVENGSGFFEEEEPLTIGLKRLDALQEAHGPLVYIGFTWNSENRFGGGAHTQIGLKDDGKALLHYLHGRKIAYDCSHNSDLLMQEALAYIDAKKLSIPLIASHSNSRHVANVPRNLPDFLIREIFQRGGVIGLNCYRPFVSSFEQQLDHFLKLGGEKQLCFGADFFFDEDLPAHLRKPPQEIFYDQMSDSSGYPYVLNLWKNRLSAEGLQRVASTNLRSFLETLR